MSSKIRARSIPLALLGIENESALIEMPSGPTKFRTTSVRPYMVGDDDDEVEDDACPPSVVPSSPPPMQPPPSRDSTDLPVIRDDENEGIEPGVSATSVPPLAPIKRGRGRPRKHPIQVNFVSSSMPFMINGEGENPHLKMPQFAASRHKEITGLIEKGVFELANPDDIPPGARIFNSRSVDEVKHPGTEKAYEKSRLVVQAYNDQGKDTVLTQSPTIQRASQRLILCVAAMIKGTTNLYLRDVTQAYVQSTSSLNRDFFIKPPTELATMLGTSSDCILRVMKPLYGVPEAGNHWFATYHKHHTEKLGMSESTYDSCLLFKHEPLGGRFADR